MLTALGTADFPAYRQAGNRPKYCFTIPGLPPDPSSDPPPPPSLKKGGLAGYSCGRFQCFTALGTADFPAYRQAGYRPTDGCLTSSHVHAHPGLPLPPPALLRPPGGAGRTGDVLSLPAPAHSSPASSRHKAYTGYIPGIYLVYRFRRGMPNRYRVTT
jgi:hypothetical protein